MVVGGCGAGKIEAAVDGAQGAVRSVGEVASQAGLPQGGGKRDEIMI